MAKKRILVIDDEKDFTSLLKRYLESKGDYEVREENSALESFSAIKEFKPDLILLDIVMPGIEGDKLCYELQRSDSTKNIPVVFLSGIATGDEIAERDNVVGGRPFVSKPVNIQNLVAIIEKSMS